ncbi:hypothetical protein pCLasGDXH1_gp07 [Liberibacter phage pCLasGDXH1]|nr:hypothetical protein pCLasGDDQ7_gp07 [Liberibacter phage pCLasGDDQ7]QHZ60183.1 hypothetical protein pCLasGDXH1_gp07 [Liberibacter phage pCLasGDXH1]
MVSTVSLPPADSSDLLSRDKPVLEEVQGEKKAEDKIEQGVEVRPPLVSETISVLPPPSLPPAAPVVVPPPPPLIIPEVEEKPQPVEKKVEPVVPPAPPPPQKMERPQPRVEKPKVVEKPKPKSDDELQQDIYKLKDEFEQDIYKLENERKKLVNEFAATRDRKKRNRLQSLIRDIEKRELEKRDALFELDTLEQRLMRIGNGFGRSLSLPLFPIPKKK